MQCNLQGEIPYFFQKNIAFSKIICYTIYILSSVERKLHMPDNRFYKSLMTYALDLGEGQGYDGYSLALREENRADFYGNYAGMFALGILLSIVFILAAVLIIYYKQLTEGY